MDEPLGETVREPAGDHHVPGVRLVLRGVAPPPLVERPGVGEVATKGPRRGEILGREPQPGEGGEAAPVAALIAKGGDSRLGAHPRAGEQQGAVGGGEEADGAIDRVGVHGREDGT